MAVDDELTPLFLLHDEPIGSHGASAFKADPFARTIAQAALGTTGPFTIGVYGGWGSGKTSALHAARTMIDDAPGWSHVVTVEFNAWRYEREDHPIVPLVATIEREVAKKAAALARKNPAKYKTQVGWYKNAKMQCRAFLAGWQFKLAPEINIPFVGKLGAEATWTAAESLKRYADLQKELKALDGEQWSALRDSCLSLSVFDTLDAVGEAVGHAAGDAKANWPLVVVFIDDLDRCQADKAFELLESVKLVLCQPGFVFVLALNHAVVDGYLTHRAEQLYGKDKASLHKSYLEKIVQLPLAMPARSERFTAFAEHLLDERLSKAADESLRAGLRGLAKVLALSANRTPRSLVRRINTALIDIALRDPAVLPDSLKRETTPYPHFSGLCIVQRTLEAALGPELTRTIAEDDALCEVIAKGNIWGINDALKVKADEKPGGTGRGPGGGGTDAQSERARAEWSRVLDAIWSDAANKFLYVEDADAASQKIAGSSVFTSPEGKRWLTKHAERRAIMRITVQRPDESEATAPAARAGDSERRPSGTFLPEVEWTKGGMTAWLNARIARDREQRKLIEWAVRVELKLAPDAPLGPAERAQVTSLSLAFSNINDAGAKLLAKPTAGYAALRTLDLAETHVTDAGADALLSARSSLSALCELDLGGTQVTNDWALKLAEKGIGPKSLTELDLRRTNVGASGAEAIRQANPGVAVLI